MLALQWLSRHSPLLMLLCCLVGFGFASTARILLPFLPYILFFLMFFTLLGINQKRLLICLLGVSVWRFAVVHIVLMCLFFTGSAWTLGVRGDLLLAIAAVTATAPLFATGALVKSVGYDALQAMANTIATTLLMPLILLVVLWLFGRPGATVDIPLYIHRLVIYIASPMLLAALCRYCVNEHLLERIYPRVSQLTVVLVFAFPIGLTAAYRDTFEQSVWLALLYLGIGSIMSIGAFALMFLLYRHLGNSEAIPAAIAGGSRNVLLTYTIAAPFLGSEYLPLIGALQLPMYMLPLISRSILRRHVVSGVQLN